MQKGKANEGMPDVQHDRLIPKMLKSAGYAVLSAESPVDGLETSKSLRRTDQCGSDRCHHARNDRTSVSSNSLKYNPGPKLFSGLSTPKTS